MFKEIYQENVIVSKLQVSIIISGALFQKTLSRDQCNDLSVNIATLNYLHILAALL